MLQVFGDLLPYSVPVALSALPIIAVLMLLVAPVGNRGGLCFLAGRVASLAALTLVFARLAVGIGEATDAAESRPWLRIGLGVAMIAGAAILVRRAAGASDDLPGWMRRIESATPGRALWLGVLLTIANLKELALVAGAGTIIGTADLSVGGALVLSAAFAVIAAVAVAAPVGWSLMLGDRAKAKLGPPREWLVRNQSVVMAAVLLTIGAVLIGGGLQEVAV